MIAAPTVTRGDAAMPEPRKITGLFGSFFSRREQVFTLVLVLCCAANGLPPAARPYSRMDLPWWHDRFEAKAAELRAHHVDLVWYGDSITQDFEQAGPEPWRNFRPVWDRFYGARNAINLGFKGDATAHLLWRIEHGEADGISPRLAIVLIGANNFGHLHWPAEPTLIGIETVVAALHSHLPHTQILLLGVLPSIRSTWVDENTVSLNRDLAARYGGGADPMVTFKDLTYLFVDHGRVVADRFLDTHLTPPDPPLHPSAQTQAQIAEAIEPDVRRMMGDRTAQ
jgi:lysophospholipase L1-like esterase